MIAYQLQLRSGRVVDMAGRNPDHAVERGADLWPDDPPIAWRQPPVAVTILGDPRRIIG